MTFAEWWQENQLDYLINEEESAVNAVIASVAERVWNAARAEENKDELLDRSGT